MNKSNRILCNDFKLDWNQGPFKILGVTFTAEVFDIWDKNTTGIEQKVENIIKTWSKRKLTLPGKITIIKSLALSKFAHLFMGLPNPPGILVKRLNKLFYTFLWNSCPDRIKRKYIIKDIEKGKYQTEKYISRLHNKHEKFQCKWSKLSHILDV